MSLLSHHVSAIQFNLFSLSLLQELGGHNPETLCELEFEKGKAGDLNFPDVYRWPDGIEVHIFPGDVPTREDSYFNCCCYDVSLMLSQYFVTSLSLYFVTSLRNWKIAGTGKSSWPMRRLCNPFFSSCNPFRPQHCVTLSRSIARRDVRKNMKSFHLLSQRPDQCSLSHRLDLICSKSGLMKPATDSLHCENLLALC